MESGVAFTVFFFLFQRGSGGLGESETGHRRMGGLERFGEVWSTRGLSISYDLEDVGKSGFNQIGRQPGDIRCGFIDLRWTD